MNDQQLESSFINLYDTFLSINLHIQKSHPEDAHLKGLIKQALFCLEDINAYYYYQELGRRVEDDEQEESH